MIIKLTRSPKGSIVYINTNKIEGFQSSGNGTVLFIGDHYYVKETPEEIYNLIEGKTDNPYDGRFTKDEIKVLKPNNDGWIEWKGGDCPVGDKVMIDAVLKNDSKVEYQVGSQLNWSNCGHITIVKYRIVK